MGIISHLLTTTNLSLHLIRDKRLVLLERLLDVHLELDDIVEHLGRLGVELLAKRVSAESELLIPVLGG